jgi:hypothetical protein
MTDPLILGRSTTGRPWASSVAVVLLVMVACGMGGIAAALGSVLVVGVFAASLVGVALLMNPRVHLVFGLAFAMVITGVLESFFFFGQANWLSSLLVGAMLIPATMKLMWDRSERRGLTAFGLLVTTYLLLLAASSALNRIDPVQAIVGVRSYLPYVGVAALLVYGGLSLDFLRKLPTLLLWVGLLQLPVALVQHFIVGPWRGGLRSAIGRDDEAIVGTFGGSVITGGYTGEMAAFLVMMVMLLLALRREGRVTVPMVILGACALLLPILLAETKIALVLLPLLLLACFGSDALRRPKFALGLAVGGAILIGAVILTYFNRYWQDGGVAMKQLGYSFDPEFMVRPGHRGRVGTIVHWFNTNVLSGDVVGSLIGHGVASSVEGSLTLGAGSAVRRFGTGLDSHAMSRLLWDGGLLTFGVFVLLCVRAFIVSWRLARRHDTDPIDRANLTCVAAISLGMLVMLPYQVSALGGSAMQFLFWFSIGFAEVMRRRNSPARAPVMRS